MPYAVDNPRRSTPIVFNLQIATAFNTIPARFSLSSRCLFIQIYCQAECERNLSRICCCFFRHLSFIFEWALFITFICRGVNTRLFVESLGLMLISPNVALICSIHHEECRCHGILHYLAQNVTWVDVIATAPSSTWRYAVATARNTTAMSAVITACNTTLCTVMRVVLAERDTRIR